MTKLGYMARDQHGHTIHLPGATHPRKALLRELGATAAHKIYAEKMYVDTKSGKTKHIGYIVRGQWFTLYEVHEWRGKGA